MSSTGAMYYIRVNIVKRDGVLVHVRPLGYFDLRQGGNLTIQFLPF